MSDTAINSNPRNVAMFVTVDIQRNVKVGLCLCSLSVQLHWYCPVVHLS